MRLVIGWMVRRAVVCVGVCIIAGAVWGCAGGQQVPVDRTPQEALTEPRVLLGPGDVLQITFRYTPELNVDEVVIRPDGKIALPSVGEVEAAGKTPWEFRDTLMDLYAIELTNQEIIVNVLSLYSRRVYVNGEVNAPGMVEFIGQMTALDAVVAAGGFATETAGANRVMVIRYEDGVQRGYKVNLDQVLDGDESEPFYLMPYDVINVPRSRGAAINHFVNQYVNGMIPQVILSSIPFIVYREYFQD